MFDISAISDKMNQLKQYFTVTAFAQVFISLTLLGILMDRRTF